MLGEEGMSLERMGHNTPMQGWAIIAVLLLGKHRNHCPTSFGSLDMQTHLKLGGKEAGPQPCTPSA